MHTTNVIARRAMPDVAISYYGRTLSTYTNNVIARRAMPDVAISYYGRKQYTFIM